MKNIYLKANIEKTINKLRIDKIIPKIFPNYSRSMIQTWIINGCVRLNGKIIHKPKKKINEGGKIEVKTIIKPSVKLEPQKINLSIIYEDHDIIVINKPNNLVIHPGIGNTKNTLLNALLYYYPPIKNIPRAGIIHRLDKNTTGLTLIAKKIESYTYLINLLLKKKITREYDGIVHGKITNEGKIEQPIARHPKKRTMMTVNSIGKKAITYYKIIKNFNKCTQLKFLLETGRTHQIRVHMSYIKHPLVGDKLYNKNISNFSKKNELLNNFNRQALNATILKIQHPTYKKEMKWCIPLPNDMLNLIEELKKNK